MSAPQENIQVADQAAKKKVSLKKNISMEDFDGPKKPQSAFMLYSAEVREAVTAEIRAGLAADQKFNISMVAKKIGEQWKTVDEGKRAALLKKQEELKAKYDADLEAFKASASYKAYVKATALHQKKKADKKALTDAKASGMPQRPMVGYMLFGNEIREAVKAELVAKGEKYTVQSNAVITKQKWTALGEEGQKKYNDQYLAAKAKYDSDLKAWNESEAGIKFNKAKATNAKRKQENQKVGKKAKKQKTENGAAEESPEEDDDEEIELSESPEESVEESPEE